MRNDQLLEEGFCYFEIAKVKVANDDGSPKISRNGDKMIELTLLVVDKSGNTGNIYEYITDKMPWKIASLERCLDVKFFVGGGWNPDVLRFKCGMGTVKTNISKDPKYSDKSSVGAYLPMEVVKSMADVKDMAANYLGEETRKKMGAESVKPSYSKDVDLDDDVPF